MAEPMRRRVFVDPEFQGALARRVAVHWITFFVAGLVITWGLELLANPHRSALDQFFAVGRRAGGFWLAMFCLLPAFVYDTVKLSHRVAGPMVRLRDALRRLANGDTATRLVFRKDDFWQDLAQAYNKMMDDHEALDKEQLQVASEPEHSLA